jgi:hypothetical protein
MKIKRNEEDRSSEQTWKRQHRASNFQRHSIFRRNPTTPSRLS